MKLSRPDYEWVATVRLYYSSGYDIWKACSDGHEVEHESPVKALSLLFRKLRRDDVAPDMARVLRVVRGGERTVR